MNEGPDSSRANDFITPHGGSLKELVASGQRVEELRNDSIYLPTWDLNQRQLCDIELLLNGGFSPLDGFMGQADYDSVCKEMRLQSGVLWPMPITLDVNEAFSSSISREDRIALRHPEGMVLAVLKVNDVWKPDVTAEMELVYGTTDESHPGVFALSHQSNRV